MLIILEGPDGAGKTTLVNRLQVSLPDAVVLHAGPPESHPLYEYETPIYLALGYHPGFGMNVICDRWHLGEVIYPHVLGRPSHLDPPALWHIEMFLEARGAFMVHVTDDHALLQERVQLRGDALITPEAVPTLANWYDHEVERSRLPHLTLSSGWEDYNKIVSHARNVEQLHTELGQFVTYVGPRWPDMLLLGDTRNDVGIAPLRDAPAFMPFRSTSGHYLLNALLTRLNATTARVGLANACDVDDPRKLWDVLGKPNTIALGKHAAKAAPWARPVDHPQYVRRFHHRHYTTYAQWIMYGETPPWR